MSDRVAPKQWGSPRCAKCGMSFEGFLGYVCSQSHCPMMPVTYHDDPEWKKAHELSKY